MRNVRLPYVNNATAVLLTVAINVAVVFLFHSPGGVTYQDILWDSMTCAVITTIINMWIVYASLQKMRDNGQMPAQVPVNRLMQRLPRNPVALGAVYAVVFAAMTVGANAAVLWFFEMPSLAFWPWMAYKLIYATLLSVKIAEYCVFRYVQPDWAATKPVDGQAQPPPQSVKDPLPRISVFKAIYGSVTGNIATNMLIGLVLGGIAITPDRAVVVYPTTVEGIPITGLVFGLIIGILVTGGVVKEMNAGILTPGAAIPEGQAADRRFAWMPKRKGALLLFVCVCVMIFSAAALWSLMRLFGISVMNAYQYAVFMTVYASIIGKPLSYALVRRCAQPDYIRYVLGRAKESAAETASRGAGL